MKKKMLFMTLFLVTAVTSFQKIIAMRNLIGLFFLSVALAACTSAPRNEVLSYTDFPRTLELKGRLGSCGGQHEGMLMLSRAVRGLSPHVLSGEEASLFPAT